MVQHEALDFLVDGDRALTQFLLYGYGPSQDIRLSPGDKGSAQLGGRKTVGWSESVCKLLGILYSD